MAKFTEFLKASQTLVIWILIVVVGWWIYQWTEKDLAYENSIRQLDGKFTEQEMELMRANESIGKLKSTLATKDEMLRELNKSKLLNTKELKRLQDEFDLEIDTFATIVANLDGYAEGGHGEAIPIDGSSFAYKWVDEYDRFHLTVPNIRKDAGIEFKYNQWFRVEAVTFKQQEEDGQIRVESVKMAETTKDGKVIKSLTIDADQSDFKFDIVPPNPPKQGMKFVAGLSSNAELMAAWEPKRLFGGQFGWGPAVFGNKDAQYAGLELTYYPKFKKTNFEVGVGVSGGYGTGGESVVRAHVLITVATGR